MLTPTTTKKESFTSKMDILNLINFSPKLEVLVDREILSFLSTSFKFVAYYLLWTPYPSLLTLFIFC